MIARKFDELHEKIKKGVLLANKRLIAETKKHDGVLVIEKNGKIVKVKARALK